MNKKNELISIIFACVGAFLLIWSFGAKVLPMIAALGYSIVALKFSKKEDTKLTQIARKISIAILVLSTIAIVWWLIITVITTIFAIIVGLIEFFAFILFLPFIIILSILEFVLTFFGGIIAAISESFGLLAGVGVLGNIISFIVNIADLLNSFIGFLELLLGIFESVEAIQVLILSIIEIIENIIMVISESGA